MTTNKNIFENEVHKYWENDLTVTPIPPGTKRWIKNGQHFIDQIPNAKRKKEWLAKYADHGIGLLTGKKVCRDNIIIGIDVDEEPYVEPIKRIFGPVVSGKKGEKGLTIFVLAEPSVKHTTINVKVRTVDEKTGEMKCKKERAVDILVRKCCVLPPTLHPKTGQPYKWEGTALPDCDLSTLPVVTKQEVELLKAIIENPNHESLLGGEATHDPAVSLTASLAGRFGADMIIRFLNAFLPEDYKGNLRDELEEMVHSAKKKGLGGSTGLIYKHKGIGPLPIGYTDNGNYVFLHQDKNILSVSAPGNLMSVAGLCDLAPYDFWLEMCPVFNKDGFPTGKFETFRVGNALMEECRKTGSFIALRVRGNGIWHENGTIVQNLRGPLPQSDHYTYVRFEELPEFYTDKAVDAQKVLSLFNRFIWVDPGYAKLLLGWTALAPICGALVWRTHIFIHGPKNTGKTTLIGALSSMLYPMVITLDGTSTEAGIRQSIGADSRPVVLDEFESDHNTSRMRKVLKLARSSSSGGAAPIARGTPEGKAIQFQVNSSFCFGAIIPIPGSAADASRIVELELAAHNNDRDTKQKIAEGLGYLHERRSAWCHQMIELIDPINESIKVFAEVMPPGGDSRHEANMANLLGAAFAALNERPATQEEAQEWISEHETMLSTLALAHEEDDSGDCLNHLLSFSLEDCTIGDILLETMKPSAPRDPTTEYSPFNPDILLKHGIKPVQNGFLVAYKHRELNRVFQSTIWENGAWKTALKRLPGAKTGDEYRARFSGGPVIRCVFIPYDLLKEESGKHVTT